jgi:competence protein ComEC
MVDSQPTSINNKTTFTLQAQEIQSGRFKSPCCGKLIVYCKGKTNFAYGDIVILKGDLSRPYSFGNKRYRAYLANQGIFALLRVRCGEEIITVARNKGLAIKRFSLQLKDKIESSIFSHVPFLAASILDAMLLGEKRNIPPLVYRSMMKSGTVHILVVSGFNTGIVAFIVLLVLKLLRLPRKIRFVLAIGGLVIYCFATGASTPVVRATVMTSILLASYLVKQDADIYNSLSIAALSILLANPRQIFDIGFQLSFASVFSIAYLYPKLQRFFQIETLKIKPLKVLLEGGLVSFSAWLGTVGFIAYHFRMFSAVTVLANILIVPLATLITLCGFSLILVSLILPCLTPYFSASSELAVKLLLQVNTFLISLPGAYLYFP